MKYRKKPVVVDAEQFWPEKTPWPDGVFRDNSRESGWSQGKPARRLYSISTLEGVHDVTPGDWIITGIKGEKYPCKPDIFALTYEPDYQDTDKGRWLRDMLRRLKEAVDKDLLNFRAVDLATGKPLDARLDYGLTRKGHELLGQDPDAMKATQEHCPSCGAVLIGFSGPTRSTPVPGDVSVCSKCGNAQMIGPDGKRRPLEKMDWANFTDRERRIIEEMRRKVKRA